MSDVSINLVCCTDVILNEIARGVVQKDIALTYAMAIKSDAEGADKPDWPIINRAIIKRWGMSGLERVKKRAFDLLAGKVTT